MFAHGATPGKVKMWTYDEEDEDFTKGNLGIYRFCLQTLTCFINFFRHNLLFGLLFSLSICGRCNCSGYLGARAVANSLS
jgi:hypothetical protein